MSVSVHRCPLVSVGFCRCPSVLQRAMAKLDPARREEKNEQRHTRRGDPTRREEEQSNNTSQRATARLDPARREKENEQQHTRREQPGVLGHESIQRATARLDPARREEENAQQHTMQEQPGVLAHEARTCRIANANKHVVMETKFVNGEYLFYLSCGLWDQEC